MDGVRITIVGAGSVGASSAAVMARKHLGDIFIHDVVEDLAAGRAMDINQASASLHTDSRVCGSDSPDILAGSDIVVVTAGIARHAGMSRQDLLNMNVEVVKKVGDHIMEQCPKAKVLVVTNPVDVLTWYLNRRHPDMDVFGLGCSLDTLRFRFFMAEAARVSVDCCQGMVIGTHNDDMIPLTRLASICGIPLDEVLEGEAIEAIVERTRVAGTTIVQKLRQHSGFYAAAHSIAHIVESIAFNRREIFPINIICKGDYGYEGISLALPCVVDKNGVSRVIQIALDERERALLDTCASSMREVTNSVP